MTRQGGRERVGFALVLPEGRGRGRRGTVTEAEGRQERRSEELEKYRRAVGERIREALLARGRSCSKNDGVEGK